MTSSERRSKGCPGRKREALNEAVSEGRAVDDENLAPLAAEWAAERQREMLRIYFGILVPVLVVGLVLLLWLLVSNDPEGSVGGALFAGGTGVVMMGLILWAVTALEEHRNEKSVARRSNDTGVVHLW